MTDFIPNEKGVPIRMPSTANLQVDSSDRFNDFVSTGTNGTAGSFYINRGSNLLNGFFTRITPTEIALDWRVPNVSPTGAYNDLSNNQVRIDVSGASTIDTTIITLPTGLYTCADAINYWLTSFNDITGYSFYIRNVANMNVEIYGDNSGVPVYWRFNGTNNNELFASFGFNTAANLGLNPFSISKSNILNGNTNNSSQTSYCLAKYKYLDFVSSQLTNQQDVKDGTTNRFFNRDSLFRWYLGFTTDTPEVDSLGFPIYPTYKTFFIRRDLSNPKCIKWQANQPVGQLQFEVYAARWLPTDSLDITTFSSEVLNRNDFSWMMTLQASEV